MQKLSRILSPDLNPHDLIAVAPEWRRADFNRAVFYLSGRLKVQGMQTAALWFDDAALFACAILAAWHAGARVVLPPNLAAENIGWADDEADIWLTDVPQHAAFSDGLNVLDVAACLENMPSECESNTQDWQLDEKAQARLKTSGSSGAAQVVVKTLAQMQAEAQALTALLPFAQSGAVALGSVSPQHLYGFTFRFAVPLSAGWPLARAQYVYP
ncbi:MAG: AMP-binding protein, partial [Neisseria sp.]|nr:AMP-binding protein [Neisseria sp.]